MSTRELVQRVAAAYAAGHTKVASGFPFPKSGPPQAAPLVGSSPDKRNIPQDHPFDSRALKPMAKALWASSVSLGHALTAYRQLSRLKSTTVSPDGMIGGRGFIMNVKDVRHKLFEACEALSAITDTLHDEIQAPHWKPKLAQLDETDAEDVTRFVEESQGLLDNPEAEAEEDMEDVEKGKKDDEEPQASKLPSAGPAEESEAQPAKPTMKEASAGYGCIPWRPTPVGIPDYLPGQPVLADSSVDPDTLPGPRVDSLDRGEQTGPEGSFNEDEWAPSDDWTAKPEHGTYNYEGENDFREANLAPMAESGMPKDDDTPTEAWDFGLGFGAKGQGAGGYENPSGEGAGNKGVWGPHSGLPGNSNVSVNDNTPIVDVNLNERHAIVDTLPGDTDEPVARSDYYTGWKGNLVQGCDGPMGESELPQEPTPIVENAPSLVDTAYVSEDAETPYVRYDYTTHEYRNDPLHNWPQGSDHG